MSENSQVLIRGESKNEEDFDLNMIKEQKSNKENPCNILVIHSLSLIS